VTDRRDREGKGETSTRVNENSTAPTYAGQKSRVLARLPEGKSTAVVFLAVSARSNHLSSLSRDFRTPTL